MKKVVVAMSGGVDSSVAAALLKEQGYDVIGVTLRLSNWTETERRKFGGCCGSSDFYDARSVAQTLDIPHYSFDYANHFRQSVIGYFKDSYLAGETPNPCIACNQHVKFDRLLDHAKALGADYLATGHYARIESSSIPSPLVGEGEDGGAKKELHPPPLSSPARGEEVRGRNFLLKKALDPSKDQSYVLYHLTQEQLSRILFPLGHYAKTQVRDIARRYGLRTADKPDSQEICFVPNADYRAFLKEEVPAGAISTGPIRHLNGTLLGQHQGLPFYTIGQREGLGIAVGRPLYVIKMERQTHTLVVGEKTDVYCKKAVIRQVSWVAGDPPPFPLHVSAKIRYKHAEAEAEVESIENLSQKHPPPLWGRTEVGGTSQRLPPPSSPSPIEGEGIYRIEARRGPNGGGEGGRFLVVTFNEPQSAITPGQAAVFYEGDVVLGGGVIDHVVRD